MKSLEKLVISRQIVTKKKKFSLFHLCIHGELLHEQSAKDYPLTTLHYIATGRLCISFYFAKSRGIF